MEDNNVSFSESVYDAIIKYSWPGNVRQLQKWVERICRFYQDTKLEWADIKDNLKPELPNIIGGKLKYPDYPIDYNRFTDQLRERAIKEANGNMSEADRLLGQKEGTTKQWKFQRERKK